MQDTNSRALSVPLDCSWTPSPCITILETVFRWVYIPGSDRTPLVVDMYTSISRVMRLIKLSCVLCACPYISLPYNTCKHSFFLYIKEETYPDTFSKKLLTIGCRDSLVRKMVYSAGGGGEGTVRANTQQSNSCCGHKIFQPTFRVVKKKWMILFDGWCRCYFRYSVIEYVSGNVYSSQNILERNSFTL